MNIQLHILPKLYANNKLLSDVMLDDLALLLHINFDWGDSKDALCNKLFSYAHDVDFLATYLVGRSLSLVKDCVLDSKFVGELKREYNFRHNQNKRR